MGLFSFIFRRKPKPKNIKIGLALGSGGAKGYAELGALKAFEENGIQFDIIAGTSIGSVIGAFIADGFSSTDICEMLKGIDLGEVKDRIMIKMDTAKMRKVIDRYIGGKNIEELKKPFTAIATVEDSGEEYRFTTGSVADALCASSAYPPFFKSVAIDGERFLDGAFSNSVPADVLKENGADFVIGIDLANHESKPSFLTSLIPTYKGKVKEPWGKGYSNADIMLHPNLNEYKPVYFWLGDQMYDIGYACAMEKMQEILDAINNLRFPKKQKKQKKRKDKKIKIKE